MNDEHVLWKWADTGFALIGLAACAAAVFASGGLAILAGAIAIGCLVGSLAVSVFPRESPCERYLRGCEETPAIAVEAEPGISQGQETGQSHHWRHFVAAKTQAGRCH